MEKIAKKWVDWKEGKDDGWIYDECHDFVAELSRGEILTLLETLNGYNK